MTHAALRAALITLFAAPALAFAQAYPNKPLRVVVPFAPGGAVDTIARLVGGKMSEQMGQPVVVDNRPGASANLGAEMVAKAVPDGYTLLMGSNGLATNVTLFPKLGFDARRDFSYIVRIGYAPLVVVVHPEFPARTFRELIAQSKAQPGKFTYGTAGNGSSGHLAGEMLKIAAGIDVLHVPYKGGAPAIADLLGQRISMMPINPVEVLSHIRSGKLRVLAVGSDKRVAMLPDVPTVMEQGYADYQATVWWGLVAPTGTPAEAVSRLNAEGQKALGDAGLRAKLAELGVVIETGSPEAFDRFYRAEVDRWAKVINASKIVAD